MCSCVFGPQDSIAERESWREQLVRELSYFESEYNSLMYGGTPITQVRTAVLYSGRNFRN